MLADQPDLLSWRGASTTSGPRPTAADGQPVKATSRERWDAWAKEYPTHAVAVLWEARVRVTNARTEGRAPRVSAKALAEWVRSNYVVSINNSATAGLGEWLSEHEDLRPYVERRARKAAP
jgi:hypothetical protein